ncbi:uncharacterized protein SPSC_06201 [Sporisorium scitamineum]|uniref:Effector family protein Eff1 n=1 Tax=Sporisorium scitamineum TaxID=49012 RepID=A0A0F7RVV2_9BASI|nr:hypothetical protein [Sporisorium scitamineum]CDU26030.1 uncharacterized protein SPSC_06201 [Sporisorium scitamineum]
MRSTLVSLVLAVACVALHMVAAAPMHSWQQQNWNDYQQGAAPQTWSSDASHSATLPYYGYQQSGQSSQGLAQVPNQVPHYEPHPYAPRYQAWTQPSVAQSPAQGEHFDSPEEAQWFQYLDALGEEIGRDAARATSRLDEADKAAEQEPRTAILRPNQLWQPVAITRFPFLPKRTTGGVKTFLHFDTHAQSPERQHIHDLFGGYLKWSPEADVREIGSTKLRDLSPLRRGSRILPVKSYLDSKPRVVYMTDHASIEQINKPPQGNSLRDRSFYTFWTLPPQFVRGKSEKLVILGAASFESKDKLSLNNHLESTVPALEHAHV